jgi:hypothetical protein
LRREEKLKSLLRMKSEAADKFRKYKGNLRLQNFLFFLFDLMAKRAIIIHKIILLKINKKLA